jgi:hypothetical protein
MLTRHRLPAFLLGLIVLVLAAACSNSSSGESDARSGNVRVMLTSDTLSTATTNSTSVPLGTTGTFDDDDDNNDDILSRLEHVNVTFSSLLARNLDGDLVDLVIDLPRTVDLIGLMNGQQITLPTGTLPPGMYDQIVVVIRSVEFVFLNGGKIELTPPGGGWTKIVPVAMFEVIEGQTTTIELRFKPLGAFRELDGEFEFFPDFDCRSESD